MTSDENGSCPITMYLPPDAKVQSPSPDLLVSPLDLFYAFGPWFLDSLQSDPSTSLSNIFFNYINSSYDTSSKEYSHHRDEFTDAAQGQIGSILFIMVGSILAILPLLWIQCRLIVKWLSKNKLIRNYLMCRQYLKNLKRKQNPTSPNVSKYVVWFQVISYLLVILISTLAAVAYFLVVFSNPFDSQVIAFENDRDVKQVESTGNQDMDCAFDSYIVNSFASSLANISQEPTTVSEMYFANSGLKNINIEEVQLLLKPLKDLTLFSAKINFELRELVNSSDCGKDETLLTDDIYVLNLTSAYMEQMISVLPSLIIDSNDTLTQGIITQQSLEDNLQVRVLEQQTSFFVTQSKVKNVVDEVTTIATSLNQWTWVMAVTLQNKIVVFNSQKTTFLFILECIFVGVLTLLLVTTSNIMLVVLLWRKTKPVQHILTHTKRVLSVIWYLLALSTSVMFVLAIINFTSTYPLSTMCGMLDLKNDASNRLYSTGPSYSIRSYENTNNIIFQRDLWQSLPESRTIFGLVDLATSDGNIMKPEQILYDLNMETTSLEMCSTVQDQNLTLTFNEDDAYSFEDATKHFGYCKTQLAGRMKHNAFLPECVLNKEPTRAEQLLMELQDFTLAVEATFMMANYTSHVLQTLNGFDQDQFKNLAQTELTSMFAQQETFVNQTITAYMDELNNVLYRSDSVLRNYQNPVFTFCNQYRLLPSSYFVSEGLLGMVMLLTLINLQLTGQTLAVEERQLVRSKCSSTKGDDTNAEQTIHPRIRLTE